MDWYFWRRTKQYISLMKNFIPLILTALTLSLGLFSNQTRAQENVVKLELSSLALRTVNLAYERVLSDQWTIQGGIKYTIPKVRDVGSLFSLEFEGQTYESPFESVTTSAFAFMAEGRFYASGKSDAPRGFYIMPFFKFSQFGLKSEFTGTFTETNGNVIQETVIMKGTFTPVGIGASLGAQWLINDVFSIDWTFFSLGGGLATAAIKITNNNVDIDQSQIDEIAQDVQAEAGIFGTPTITTGSNFARLAISTPWPILRQGLTIGYAF